MIKVAIADDELENIHHIEEVLKVYSEKRGVEFRTYAYENSSLLKQDIENGHGFDIFFLDIEMPEKTGLEVAYTIRKYFFESFIIFITNHSEYASDGYEISAYQYLLKDQVEEKLPHTLDNIIPDLERIKTRYYVVEQPKGVNLIQYSSIIKIRKRDQKYSIITTRDGETIVRSSLTCILHELDSDDFIFVHKGVIVNLSHVNGIAERIMTLSNGDEVEVIRNRIQDMKRAVSEYYRRK